MADNLGFNPHAGERFATDDIGGVHHIRFKVQHGADGAATDASALAPLPVIVTNSVSGELGPSTAVALPGSSGAIAATPITYRGIELRETTGTTGATVVLYDNASAGSGSILGTYSLAPGESRSEEFPTGRTATAGIWATITGTVQGSTFISPVTFGASVAHTLTGTPPTSQAVSATAAVLRGIDVRETTGTTVATIVLYDNASAASGTILGTYALSPGESRSEEFSVGRVATNGIYAAVTGTVQCSVFGNA